MVGTNPGNKALVVYAVLPDRSVFDFADGLSNAELICYMLLQLNNCRYLPTEGLIAFSGQILPYLFISCSFSFSFKMS